VTFAQLAAVVVAVLACVWDLRTRRLPNFLTFPAMAAGLAYHGVVYGPGGLLGSLAGLGLGLLLFFPFFALGGLGAGDVKLLGALGAWLGARTVLYVAFYASLAGGALAVVAIVRFGYGRQAIENLRLLLTHWRVVGLRPIDSLTLDSARGPRLPYALPIAAGLLLAVWLC
jgi:prepilin peptidase CpaA